MKNSPYVILLTIGLMTTTCNLTAAPADHRLNPSQGISLMAANSTHEFVDIKPESAIPKVLVEAIIFSNDQPDTGEITWLADVRAQVPDTAIEPNMNPLATSYQRSDALLQMAQKINVSKYYTTIDSQAWLQTITNGGQTHPVRLQLKWQDNTIDGIISVYKSRTLHVMSDLWITRTPNEKDIQSSNNMELVLATASPMAPNPIETQEVQTTPSPYTQDGTPSYAPITARLAETRRIKTNEWNFFDHPNFGLLLRVSEFDD